MGRRYRQFWESTSLRRQEEAFEDTQVPPGYVPRRHRHIGDAGEGEIRIGIGNLGERQTLELNSNSENASGEDIETQTHLINNSTSLKPQQVN